MRPIIFITVCVAGFTGVIVLVSFAGSNPATQPDRPVSLQDIQQRGVEGRLGFRLGMIF